MEIINSQLGLGNWEKIFLGNLIMEKLVEDYIYWFLSYNNTKNKYNGEYLNVDNYTFYGYLDIFRND